MTLAEAAAIVTAEARVRAWWRQHRRREQRQRQRLLRVQQLHEIAIEIRHKVVLSINGKRLPLGRVCCCYSLPYSTCTIVRRNYMHILVVTRYRMYSQHS